MFWCRGYPPAWLRYRGIAPASATRSPQKIRLEAQKDSKASSTARVLDIIGQATDSKTKEIYVLVHWDNSTMDDDITWTFLRDLSPSTLSWWGSESERRFPHIDLVKDAPRMRITLGAVLLEFDITSDDSSEWLGSRGNVTSSSPLYIHFSFIHLFSDRFSLFILHDFSLFSSFNDWEIFDFWLSMLTLILQMSK